MQSPVESETGSDEAVKRTSGVDRFIESNTTKLVFLRKKTWIIAGLLYSLALILTAIAATIIIIRVELKSCTYTPWSRATCQNITCSPHSALPIFKEKICNGKVERTFSYCYVKSCDEWETTSSMCITTKGNEPYRLHLMKLPSGLNASPFAAFKNC